MKKLMLFLGLGISFVEINTMEKALALEYYNNATVLQFQTINFKSLLVYSNQDLLKTDKNWLPDLIQLNSESIYQLEILKQRCLKIVTLEKMQGTNDFENEIKYIERVCANFKQRITEEAAYPYFLKSHLLNLQNRFIQFLNHINNNEMRLHYEQKIVTLYYKIAKKLAKCNFDNALEIINAALNNYRPNSTEKFVILKEQIKLMNDFSIQIKELSNEKCNEFINQILAYDPRQ